MNYLLFSGKTELNPQIGSAHAAGIDLKVDAGDYEKVTVPPRAVGVPIHTGIAFEIPEGYCGLLMLRSSLSGKLQLANSVGLIDSDYRGEIIAKVNNVTNEYVELSHGERIVQLVVVAHPRIDLKQVNELSETDRGSGGFGSTGMF
ncbi:dUTP diphosphatase [Actinomyces vulturis]|uniref:dUTP diphosphatase n=1 Tax=Actinomyces vulturis TaxID=1857645 RepID=UPI00082F8521|nr:dUTP diphosphatase [Actinomyces vulturis]